MATKYVTTAGAGTNSGDDWANAYTWAQMETWIEGTPGAAPHTIYVQGNHSLSGDFYPAVAGTITDPIVFIGVVSGTTAEPPTASDWAMDTGRPLLTLSGNTVRLQDYSIFRNFRLTGTGTACLFVEDYCLVINCAANNTNSESAFYVLDNNSKFIGCDGQAASGYGFRSSNKTLSLYYCYVHDSATGTYCENYSDLVGCVFDTCTTGILVADSFNVTIANNTIYNCTTGISGTTAGAGVIYNNILHTCGTALSWSTLTASIYVDWNCFYNNSTDRSNVAVGPHDVAGDPGLTDPANGDFTISTTGAAAGAALDLGVFTGATV